MRGHPLAAMFGGMDDENDENVVKLTDDQQVERLNERLEAFKAGNPWKVGDIVHARADADFKGRGKPHVVSRTSRPRSATGTARTAATTTGSGWIPGSGTSTTAATSTCTGSRGSSSMHTT